MNNLNHIAFILDGNGRWATQKKLSRIKGHAEGVKRIPEVIDLCINENIKYMSFFCFSTENWNRPKSEVNYLMKLISIYLNKKNLKWFNDREINLSWFGFNDNLKKNLIKDINNFCLSTKKNNKFYVGIYFNYGSRQEILNACKKIKENNLEINEETFHKCLLNNSYPDVDLLIRTSGEKRISNFLLWQISYAEIIFEDTLWPDYKKEIFKKNLNDFYKRIRRFGAING